jgi:hypothetical protein
VDSELLGFAPDARVLILNCDDLGMYEAVNVGIFDAIENGVATSCSLMAPCPGAADAIMLLRERPHVPFGKVPSPVKRDDKRFRHLSGRLSVD